MVAERAAGGDLDVLPEALAAAMAGRWTEEPAALAAAPAGRVYRLRQPLRGESATAVRRAIAAGEPDWEAQVPAAVAAYIRDHGLYRAP